MYEPFRLNKPGHNNQPSLSGSFKFAKKAFEFFSGLKKRCAGVGNVFSAGQPKDCVETKKPFFKDKKRRRLVLAHFSGSKLEGKCPESEYSSPEQEILKAPGSFPKKHARYHIKKDGCNCQNFNGHHGQSFNPVYPFIGGELFVLACVLYHLASPGSIRNVFYVHSLEAKMFLYSAFFYVLVGVHVFLSAWERLWGALVANGVYPAVACAVLLGAAVAYAWTGPLYLIPFWVGVFLFAAYAFNYFFFIFMP